MAKERFVLRYRGQGPEPKSDIMRLFDLEGAVIVDSSFRMVLVESEPEPLRALIAELSDWVMGPDRTYAVPDTRAKFEGAPGNRPGGTGRLI